MPVKWNDYQQKVREYDVCAARVERSEETNRFNNTLINIILRVSPEATSIADELRAASPDPLTLEANCPKSPTVLRTFFSSSIDGDTP